MFSYGGQVQDLQEVLQLIASRTLRPHVQPAKLGDFPSVLQRLEKGQIAARVALLHD